MDVTLRVAEVNKENEQREVSGETLAQLHTLIYSNKLCVTVSLSLMLIWIYSVHCLYIIDQSVLFSCIGHCCRPCHGVLKAFESRVTLFHTAIITKIPKHSLDNNEICIIFL